MSIGSLQPEEANTGPVQELPQTQHSADVVGRRPRESEQRRCDQPRRYTFPPHLRLKRAAEFERCFAHKASTADDVLIVYGYPNQLPYPRLGCVVSRKCGRAVRRNRFKRLLREAFRLLQHELPTGIDYVVLPRPSVEVPRLESVRRSLLRLARRLARRLSEASKPSSGSSSQRQPSSHPGSPACDSPPREEPS
jgi:ribonuclease P protein component